jgi:prepilin-type N-terminal cleavage/methylation domain-containing protein
MKNFSKKNKNGFTIIEVMVVMAIFVMLIFLVVAMLNAIFVNSNQEMLSMNNIDQARIVSSAFVNEIRNATMANDGAYPLNYAGDSQIIFYSNFGSSNPAVVNRIRYYILNNNLYKGVITPTGNPLAYNLASESVKLVQSDLQNASTPLFYYYNGQYDGTGQQLLQPVNINQVRFIKINLVILNQTIKNSVSTFNISAGGTIRSVNGN